MGLGSGCGLDVKRRFQFAGFEGFGCCLVVGDSLVDQLVVHEGGRGGQGFGVNLVAFDTLLGQQNGQHIVFHVTQGLVVADESALWWRARLKKRTTVKLRAAVFAQHLNQGWGDVNLTHHRAEHGGFQQGWRIKNQRNMVAHYGQARFACDRGTMVRHDDKQRVFEPSLFRGVFDEFANRVVGVFDAAVAPTWGGNVNAPAGVGVRAVV